MFDYTLLPFFSSMIILTLIILAIGIHFWRNVLVMFIVIPVAFFCAFSGYNTIVNVLGYPVQQSIPEDSLYVKHIESMDGTELYVWVIEPNKVKPKNFRIPATDKNKKTMDSASDRSEKGVPQQIGEDKDQNGELNLGEYRTYDFTIDSQGLK